jgi:hypothetical protein
MNRYIYILCLAVLSTGICTAQIGIGTVNPVGILNVDILKNNSPTPTGSQLKDDLIFRLNTNNEANLVIGGEPLNKEASLELNAPDKALLLNKVALTSVEDSSTVPSPRDGMMVYNTNAGGSGEEDVMPGTYLNMNKEWIRLADHIVSGTSTASKIGALTSNISATPVTNKATGAGATTFILNQSIIINNAGRYVFSFRLYGGMSITGQVCDDYYLYLFKKTGATEVLLSRIDMVVGKGSSSSTNNTYFPIMQTPYLNLNDEVIIKIGRRNGAQNWTLQGSATLIANRTTFVYWKMQ